MSLVPRPALMQALIEEGTALFTDSSTRCPQGVPRANVLNWLFMTCIDRKIDINILESNRIVEEVQAAANRVVAVHDCGLTVGALRARLASLPDNMPVFYERIADVYFNDHGWKTTPFIAERWPAEDCDRQALTQTGHTDEQRLVTRDGVVCVETLTRTVGAFSGDVRETDEGRRAFVLTAHY